MRWLLVATLLAAARRLPGVTVETVETASALNPKERNAR